MPRNQVFLFTACLLSAIGTIWAAEASDEPTLIARPEAFQTLDHPDELQTK